jgi:hypothetical protein
MEPEGSLPHSQVPATYPYPEPARSSPYPQNSTSWRSSLILSSHLRLGLPSDLFPLGFPTKTLYTPLPTPIRATCPAHLISILSPAQYWVRTFRVTAIWKRGQPFCCLNVLWCTSAGSLFAALMFCGAHLRAAFLTPNKNDTFFFCKNKKVIKRPVAVPRINFMQHVSGLYISNCVDSA